MLPPPPAEAFETEIMNTAEFRPSPGMTARRSTDPNWAPVEYIERVKAVYDYEADNHDELTFDEDAIIYVVAKNEGMFQNIFFVSVKMVENQTIRCRFPYLDNAIF